MRWIVKNRKNWMVRHSDEKISTKRFIQMHSVWQHGTFCRPLACQTDKRIIVRKNA